ncbi:MAG TPA: peptide deformylase [Labilithrix sp.]|nr:peptide deformylase [Labilithrix sp.]
MPISPDIEGPAAQSGTFPRAPIRRVLTLPDPGLAQASLEVDPRDPAVVALARALVATMSASPACVGLAAPQIGELLRLLCVDVTNHAGARSCSGLVVLANPRIVHRAGNVVRVESCLSVPHLTGPVARAATVTVEGTVPGTTQLVCVTADGLEARTLLHEIDHLDGHVFPDRMLEASADLGSRR